MHFIRRNIPNAITCGNLFCGCLAIVFALKGNLILSSYLVGLAAILDFFDGFAARLLKVSSRIGKDLDSLADMVTFGVVPGLMMYQLIKMSIGFTADVHINTLGGNLELMTYHPASYHYYLPFAAFIIPIFSAIRLAKFNNDIRQSDQFIGLPTPANAIFISSLVLLNKNFVYHVYDDFQFSLSFKHVGGIQDVSSFFSNWLFHPGILIVIAVLFSFLLVAELPLFSLKFKQFGWVGNEIRYLFLMTCILFLLLFNYAGISLSILFYILLSFVWNILNKKMA
jgi:CDP-diacylglycerol--serine O-phosphatidyltransferase